MLVLVNSTRWDYCYIVLKKTTHTNTHTVGITLSGCIVLPIICKILSTFLAPSLPPPPTHQNFKHTMTSPVYSPSLRRPAMTSVSAPKRGVSFSFPWPNNLPLLLAQRPHYSNLILDFRLDTETDKSEGGKVEQWGDVVTLEEGEEW